jgi:hypothetical protein
MDRVRFIIVKRTARPADAPVRSFYDDRRPGGRPLPGWIGKVTAWIRQRQIAVNSL